MTAKAEVLEGIRRLPDDATFEEIAEMIAILAAVHRGRKDVANGRFVSHEAARAQLAAWLLLLGEEK